MARVLIVSFSVVPGPDRHGVQVLHVLRALANRFTVDVLTLRMGDLAYVERFHKTRMLRVPVPDAPLGEQLEAFRRAVRRQVEGAEYDVIHFRDGWSGLAVVERARRLGARTVFELSRSTRGEPAPSDTKLAQELARAEQICWTQADLVLTPTALARRWLASHGRAERVLVVPPGVDVDRFDWEPTDTTGPPVVCYAGALAPGRGVRVLLRAMRDVVARKTARLLLVGPVEKGFASTLDGAIKQLGLDGLVDIAGPVDNEDMPRMISRATVCIAPSAEDVDERPTACFPTKLLEYMACRRATIAPRARAVAEVIEEGVDGLLFEPGNPAMLAAKILELIGDPGLRERIAEAAHQRVRRAHPASITRRRLLEAYARLVPMSQWAPPSQAAPPLLVAADGAGGTGAHPHMFDPSTDELHGPPTAVTSAPPDPLHDTTDEIQAAAAAAPGDDHTPTEGRRLDAEGAGGPSPGFAGWGGRERSKRPAGDTEPWMVIAGDGTVSKVTRKRAVSETTDGGAATPADGLPPAPALGVAFAAGELEARLPPRVPSQSQVSAELNVEIDPDDLAFVAAGKLLGPDAPPADSRATPAGDDEPKVS